MPKIYIIIVTYNAMKWAERCFSSLRQSTIPINCIVIDNGSQDGTQEYIKNNFPEVDFIQSPENSGFGKANNLGIEKAYKAGADFIYLMNQDAWIFPDSIQELLNVYNNYPDNHQIGILSPMHIAGNERQLDIFLDKYIAHNFEKTRLISDLYFQTLQSYYEISFINAAHWFIPKKTIEIVGGFNPYFFHYGEDNEYINRLHFHKMKILLAPKSKAIHDGKQLLGKVDYNKYPDLSTETNIINPNISNALQLEKKALIQSIIKNCILRNFSIAKQLFNKYRRISAESETFNEIRAKISKKGTTFLKI